MAVRKSSWARKQAACLHVEADLVREGDELPVSSCVDVQPVVQGCGGLDEALAQPYRPHTALDSQLCSGTEACTGHALLSS